eukprot:4133372-Pyramimonas_sp.AAC.1
MVEDSRKSSPDYFFAIFDYSTPVEGHARRNTCLWELLWRPPHLARRPHRLGRLVLGHATLRVLPKNQPGSPL